MSTSEIITTPSGKKTCLSTPNPFEKKFGYYRAVRKGPFIHVSGTTALKFEKNDEQNEENLQSSSRSDDHDKDYDEVTGRTDQSKTDDGIVQHQSKVLHPHSSYDQALVAMWRCVDAVEKLGGKMEDVVRVKMFVGSPDYCGDVGNAFRKCFGATTGDNKEESEIGAAATMIVVQDGFVDKDIRVEVEVDAVVL